MISESIWSDEPPTEPGWYWVRQRVGRREYVAERNPDGIWDIFCGSAYATDGTAAEVVQFGPRVPDAKRCASLDEVTSELLKALSAFVARYDNHMVNADLLFSDIVDQARKAIAKAVDEKRCAEIERGSDGNN